MADHNDRNQGSDDLYDEAAPRSIFAATWFRAVLVLIVLGVIGAVAVPYILDAMNAPPKIAASKPSPPPSTTAPGAMTQATATPGAPPPATPAPSQSSPATTPAAPPTVPEKPAENKESMVAATTPVPEPTKPEPAKVEPKTARKVVASADAPSKPAPRMAKATTSAVRPASGGQWFVQVGAFKNPATARKVAAKLREDKYKVEESARGAAATVAKATVSPSSSAPSGGDQYDVIISGQSPADLNSRLSAKGLTAEAMPNGALVKPSLPLRDAVALSKELAIDGSKVQVRRAGGPKDAAPRTSSTATSAGGADGLHRVSVGGFADRATAVATLKELEAKGYKPFLTRR